MEGHVKEEMVGSDAEVSSQDLPSAENLELREELSANPGAEEGVSFFGLCESPPGGASAAAKRFMNLLVLHMDGAVSLEQEAPYGDILVHQGPSFQTAWGTVA
mmetsp:Transcript_105439/g.272962  ORF Transcript_105439/g.272962 Transcript_105439/m.272962 type:complete len:103 (+) Transcript_105439:656-964(+)